MILPFLSFFSSSVFDSLCYQNIYDSLLLIWWTNVLFCHCIINPRPSVNYYYTLNSDSARLASAILCYFYLYFHGLLVNYISMWLRMIVANKAVLYCIRRKSVSFTKNPCRQFISFEFPYKGLVLTHLSQLITCCVQTCPVQVCVRGHPGVLSLGARLHRCDALPIELWSLVGSRTSASSIYTRYMKRMTWCVYDNDHMSALQVKNTSESDPRSYELATP